MALVTFNLSASFSLCQVEAVLELVLQGALRSTDERREQCNRGFVLLLFLFLEK